MKELYTKPSIFIESFDVEDIITVSAGGGGVVPGGDETSVSGESETSSGSGGESTTSATTTALGGADWDHDTFGGNELQEMLENLYQNFIKYI